MTDAPRMTDDEGAHSGVCEITGPKEEPPARAVS